MERSSRKKKKENERERKKVDTALPETKTSCGGKKGQLAKETKKLTVTSKLIFEKIEEGIPSQCDMKTSTETRKNSDEKAKIMKQLRMKSDVRGGGSKILPCAIYRTRGTNPLREKMTFKKQDDYFFHQ